MEKTKYIFAYLLHVHCVWHITVTEVLGHCDWVGGRREDMNAKQEKRNIYQADNDY